MSHYTSLFVGSRPPDPPELGACLGAAGIVWDGLIRYVHGLSPSVQELWRFAGAKTGWSFRLVHKERVLLYLTPGEGRFRAGIVLGKKAVAAARATMLSPSAVSIIDAAPVYAEGHGVRVEVSTEVDAAIVREFLAVKLGMPPSSP